jgi:Bacterial Ig-like domain
MRTPRLEIVQLFAALMIVLTAGCGKETVNIADTTPPQVSSTTPAPGATTVALNTTITATFTKPMNSSTLSATSFLVTGPGGASVTGTVTYAAAGSVATFTPAASLTYGAVYTATITTRQRTRPVQPIHSQPITCGRLPASSRLQSPPPPPRPGLRVYP